MGLINIVGSEIKNRLMILPMPNDSKQIFKPSYFSICDAIYPYTGSLSKWIVFTNGPWDLGSIPGCVIPKTLKWYLIPPCLTLSNIGYVSRVKWSNPGKGVVPYAISRCSSYWKVSFLVANFTTTYSFISFEYLLFLYNLIILCLIPEFS